MKYEAQSDIWRLDQAKGSSIKIPTLRTKSREIARFQQVFPLTIFPDKIVIEEQRIVLIRNNGPWTDQVITIMDTDIACVNASTGPLFGQVHVKSLTGGPEIFLDKLFKHDVYKTRGLIEGIVLKSRGGLEISDETLEIERRALLMAGEVN
ncbi:MAG: hypothetical protein WD988_00685 [Candidatus Curtissbacteria bacterium]